MARWCRRPKRHRRRPERPRRRPKRHRRRPKRPRRRDHEEERSVTTAEPLPGPHAATPAGKPRARSLGIPFSGTPGPWNAITDVPGVQVGYVTLIQGDSVRTGVTAIHPRGPAGAADPVAAGFFSLNGNGELTGASWISESGTFSLPLAITNTHAVGIAHAGIVAWTAKHHPELGDEWPLPIAAETWDGHLNDPYSHHVTEDTVIDALEAARGGPVEEGSVGGGTGMICYEFKGGNGTASRKVEMKDETGALRSFIVGIFLQANFGRRPQLVIAGRPVGKEMPGEVYKDESGSCIAVVATDAPLLPNQLKRLARRVSLGLARTGTTSGNGSGDLFMAFLTANPNATNPDQVTHTVQTIPNDLIDPLFTGVVQATEEAVVNALVDNHSMSGRDNHHVEALSRDRLRELMKRSR